MRAEITDVFALCSYEEQTGPQTPRSSLFHGAYTPSGRHSR